MLGVAAIVRPLSVADAALRSALWLLAISAVATGLLWTRQALTGREGALLVALNLFDWVSDLLWQ